MVHIKVRTKESFEKALRRFNKAFEQSGTLATYKENRYYEKPADKRNREKKLKLRNQKQWNRMFT